jgi:hypothetical protein
MVTDAFLEVHINIWLFTSASVNVRFLWNGEQLGTSDLPEEIESAELSEKWCCYVDILHVTKRFSRTISLSGELLSRAAGFSSDTRGRTPRK